MKIKEIIVVEGRDDTAAIQRAVDADTIETRGSALSEKTIEKIKKAYEIRGVIVFTDPDYPGEKIRKTISERVPGVKHAFVSKTDALKKGDLGVENASPEVIKKALEHVKTELENADKEIISQEDLIAHGLIAGSKAKARRQQLGEILGIGYTNGKQLYKRLKVFQISEQDFNKAINLINERE